MSGDKSQLDRIEDMLTQLIHIVGSTNAAFVSTNTAVASLQKGQAELQSGQAELQNNVAKLQNDVTELKSGQADLRAELNETKDTVYRIEHRLQVMERKQERTVVRLDTVEVELELIKDKVNR